MTIKYLVSGEDSRDGRINFWNDVFLAQKSPVKRASLQVSKVTLWVSLSFVLMTVFSQITA